MVKIMYAQAWAYWDFSFQDFAAIMKFLCVQIHLSLHIASLDKLSIQI